MRFRVAVEHQALVLDFQDAHGWCAHAYHNGNMPLDAEVKAIHVLNCVGRAQMFEGKLTWDISRDDLSADYLIEIARQIAFAPGQLSVYQILPIVTQKVVKLMGYDKQRASQVDKEMRRSLMGNMNARGAR